MEFVTESFDTQSQLRSFSTSFIVGQPPSGWLDYKRASNNVEIPFILEKALWDCHHMEHNYIHTYVDYVTSLRKDTTGLFWQVSFQPNYENYKNYKITKIVIPEIKVSA